MPNTDRIEIKQMTNSFNSKSACVQYLKDTPSIINDIMILAPTNTNMSFQCLDSKEVARYQLKRESI
jgi:hypothetical protein